MRTHVHVNTESTILPEYHNVEALVKCIVTVASELGLMQQRIRTQEGKGEQEAYMQEEKTRKHPAPMLCPMLQTVMDQVVFKRLILMTLDPPNRSTSVFIFQMRIWSRKC